MPRREYKGDERGGKEHLDNGDIALVTAKDLGKGIAVVDAETLGCANGKTGEVLIEGDEVEIGGGHDGMTACRTGTPCAVL